MHFRAFFFCCCYCCCWKELRLVVIFFFENLTEGSLYVCLLPWAITFIQTVRKKKMLFRIDKID